MTAMSAWIPFITPAPGVSGYWWVLALPMSLFISMAWKAVRQDDMAGYWPAVAKMTAQVVLGMMAFFAALALVVLVIVPAIPAE
ncbi:MAG: hypothetical protein RI990_2003 [Planctomycetota bacterium]|jgi:hypothetical protein